MNTSKPEFSLWRSPGNNNTAKEHKKNRRRKRVSDTGVAGVRYCDAAHRWQRPQHIAQRQVVVQSLHSVDTQQETEWGNTHTHTHTDTQKRNDTPLNTTTTSQTSAETAAGGVANPAGGTPARVPATAGARRGRPPQRRHSGTAEGRTTYWTTTPFGQLSTLLSLSNFEQNWGLLPDFA